jgi:hypothetical protein
LAAAILPVDNMGFHMLQGKLFIKGTFHQKPKWVIGALVPIDRYSFTGLQLSNLLNLKGPHPPNSIK